MRFHLPLFVALWVVLIGCGAPLAIPAGAQSGSKSAPAGKVAEPAPVEEVQEVTAVETAASSAGTSLLGRFHPALVHFPIAWVFLLLLVELTALFTGGEEWGRVGLFILILAGLSFIPAGVTGFLRASSMKSDAELQTLVRTHRNLNLASAVFCLGALALRVGMRKKFEKSVRSLYLLLLAVCAILLFIAGHLGGKMVFGTNYLPF